MNVNKSGQAMLEFLCGLVGLTAIIAVLLQIGQISQYHLGAVVEARNTMADSMLDSSDTGEGTYLSNWQAGEDEHRYSEDDTSDSGDSGGFSGALAVGVDIDVLEGIYETYLGKDYNRMSDVAGAFSGDMVGALNTASVTVESEPLELLPGVRKLVYNVETLEFVHTIYMPWIDFVLD